MEREATIVLNIDKICRICLEEKGNAVSIFSLIGKTNSIEQSTFRVSEVIMNISNMKITANDGLPQIICRNCVASAYIANTFQINCNRSSTLLQEYSEKVKNRFKVEPVEELEEEEGEIDCIMRECKEEIIVEEYLYAQEAMENDNSEHYLFHDNNENLNQNSLSNAESCNMPLSSYKTECNNLELPNLYSMCVNDENSGRNNEISIHDDENNNGNTDDTNASKTKTSPNVSKVQTERNSTIADVSHLCEINLNDKECNSVTKDAKTAMDSENDKKIFKCRFCLRNYPIRYFAAHLRRNHKKLKEVADVYNLTRGKERRQALMRFKKNHFMQCEICKCWCIINFIDEHIQVCQTKGEAKKNNVGEIGGGNAERCERCKVFYVDNSSMNAHGEVCNVTHNVVGNKIDQSDLENATAIEHEVRNEMKSKTANKKIKSPTRIIKTDKSEQTSNNKTDDTEDDYENSNIVFEDNEDENSSNEEELNEFTELHSCNVCSRVYKSKQSLISHMKKHFSNSEFKCKDCGMLFNESSELFDHRKCHDKIRPHICKTCGKKYVRATTLKAHMRVHTGHRPYLCTVCGKGFRQAPDLNYHMRTHSTEKRYMCNVCGKTMTMQSHLVMHMRTHTGERPFKCKDCSKSFLSSTALRRHSVTHTDLKPFKCDVCDKSFNRLSSLKVHNKIHSDERLYVCSVCNKRFIQAHTMKIHMLTHTANNTKE